ncbi:MAG: hypothetical protein NT163_06940 [Chlorobiales bacterium]|nr:hypothetical protein [Chlorobiales bacterium]
MKKTMMLVLTTTLLGFGSIASAATDYSHYSDSELAGLRTKMRSSSIDERISYRQECQKRFSEQGPDTRERCMRSSEGRGQYRRINGLQERLGLNESQSAKVKELREKQFTLVVAERKEIVALNRELQKESFKTSPNQKKLEELSDKIGKKHALLAHLKSKHLTELASILTPAQRVKLQTIRDAHELRQHHGRSCE